MPVSHPLDIVVLLTPFAALITEPLHLMHVFFLGGGEHSASGGVFGAMTNNIVIATTIEPPPKKEEERGNMVRCRMLLSVGA